MSGSAEYGVGDELSGLAAYANLEQMGNQALALIFGESLSEDQTRRVTIMMQSLRPRPIKPVYVDTVFGVEANPGNSHFRDGQKWFLLFDLYRVFLYDDPMTPESPRVTSIVRSILDNYPFNRFELLAEHFRNRPVSLFYDLECVELLSRFWATEMPGRVIVLDAATAQLRVCEGHIHPQAEQSDGVEDSPTEESLTSACVAGPGWRLDSAPMLEGIESEDVGIVRCEREATGDGSIPKTVTMIRWAYGGREAYCGGSSFRATEARVIARCEAVERYQTVFRPNDIPLRYASYHDVQDIAVDPETIFFRMPKQKQQQSRLVEYDSSLPMYWVSARDAVTGAARLVPAQDVWYSTAQLPGENIFVPCTTNACAVGASVDEAALFAILEGVERDAFLTTWYLRRRCKKVDPGSVAYEPFQLLWARLKRDFPNYRLHFLDIGIGIRVPSVCAVAERERGSDKGPRALVAASARPVAERALFSALKDVAVQLNPDSPAYGRASAQKLLDSPELVVTPEDHRSLYALDETFERLAFLGLDDSPEITADQLNETSIVKQRRSYDLKVVVTQLAGHLGELGLHVFLMDITHRAFARRRIRCVKAVTPGLFPIWFGHRQARFSLTARLKELARSLTGRDLCDEASVNLEIHPFS